ncbi:exodeoxyribonuclease VII large subunit [Chryseobacterium sp. R2A-55]|uniref:exodeoxyribonuclease VII large subunit n=1 Tax=Chryseobacterium sp. R2A-55 TaxID=2744445 RepID=UPI001F403BE5|nr:exodeoxyribonuclease VII large subunit [Chryseobacterium sp. R2A-55]
MMPILEPRRTFTLSQVTASIKKTLEARYHSEYWISAEMNKLNYYSHSGHCYPELLEKKDGKVVAEMRSMLWKSNYDRINKRFEEVLKTPLSDGLKILFLAKITFHPTSGVQLQIMDIDPSYTLGDLQREKNETIDRLKSEQVFDLNRRKVLPILPQRIAIISANTSKGLGDFLKIIDENPWNYRFFHMLFPAYLQGEKAITSIVEKLQTIRKVIHHFDAVAIIRGGGGDVGLTTFNHYDISQAIANFPIPVITGIGHSTNETVAELVAYYNAITPTKTGEFLLQKFRDFDAVVSGSQNSMVDFSRMLLNNQNEKLQISGRFLKSGTGKLVEKNKGKIISVSQKVSHQTRTNLTIHHNSLNATVSKMQSVSNSVLSRNNWMMTDFSGKIISSTKRFLGNEDQKVEQIQKNINILDPINTLKRGFSITRFDGAAITSSGTVSIGDDVEINLFRGKINAKINSKE